MNSRIRNMLRHWLSLSTSDEFNLKCIVPSFIQKILAEITNGNIFSLWGSRRGQGFPLNCQNVIFHLNLVVFIKYKVLPFIKKIIVLCWFVWLILKFWLWLHCLDIRISSLSLRLSLCQKNSAFYSTVKISTLSSKFTVTASFIFFFYFFFQFLKGLLSIIYLLPG